MGQVPAAMMTTMAAMHEHVHQRACQQNEPREEGKHMGAMLGEEKNRPNNREP